jgi:hypothetical protein
MSVQTPPDQASHAGSSPGGREPCSRGWPAGRDHAGRPVAEAAAKGSCAAAFNKKLRALPCSHEYSRVQLPRSGASALITTFS